jgi:hypothetical protein
MNSNDAGGYSEIQHDLLFTDAYQFSIPLEPFRLQLESTKRLCIAFRENVSRVRAMAYVPQSVVEKATDHLLLVAQAVFNVTGKPVMEDCELLVSQQAVADEYVKLLESKYFDGKYVMRHALAQGTLINNKHFNVNTGPFRAGFISMLGSQVVSIWTAFNALTTDLWITTVNEHPELLDKLGRLQLRLRTLKEHRYNTAGHMGDILSGKMRLDSFSRTKQAYERTFQDDPSIPQILKNDNLKEVCLVRTTLVHDAGIATPGFHRQAKRFSDWKDVQIGAILPLDGQKVKRMADIAIVAGNQLLLAIDEWLVSHSKRSPKQPDPAA